MKTIANLTTKLRSAGSGYIGTVEELEEQKERSQGWLEQLKIQRSTVASPDHEVKTCDIATKMIEIPSLCQQLMMPNDAPLYSITRRFRKLSFLCHPDHGGTQKAVVRLERAHQFLTDPDACNGYELERCEAADDVQIFKNHISLCTLFSLGRQQLVFFRSAPYFVFCFLSLVVILLR